MGYKLREMLYICEYQRAEVVYGRQKPLTTMKTRFDNMRSYLKSLASLGMYYCGLLELMKYCKLKNKGFILMYHRILCSKQDDDIPIQPGMYVSYENFEKHLIYLKSNMHVIPLDELVNRVQSGLSLDRCCAMTFDDGWVDNYKYAFPLLEKYQVPATIFLATGYVGTEKWFWPEELSWCLSKALNSSSNKDIIPKSLQMLLSSVAYKKNDTKDVLIEKTINIVKEFRHTDRVNFINQLMLSYPRDEEKRLIINWEEAMEMYSGGLISFGAHTVNHSLLDELDIESMRQEILDSQKHIITNLGLKTNFFAYPNGNYTSNIVNLLLKHAFLGAVTTKRGFVEHGTPLMEMPRIGMHNDVSDSTPRFISRLLLKQF